jgi:hypothetical protein
MLIAAYFVIGFVLFWLFAGRHEVFEELDSTNIGAIAISCAVYTALWPLVVLGYEARFIGRKFFDPKEEDGK